MRWTIAFFASAVMAVAIVGCGGSTASPTPGTTLAPGATPTPAGATLPPTSAPGTATPGGGTTGTECAAYPTFSLSSPGLPSFAPDAALEAKFPTTIDGQPVSDLNTGFWAAFLCMGGQSAYDRTVAELPSGLNWAAMSYGSATYTVDGDSVDVSAFRTPGQDANGIVQGLAALAASMGNTESNGTLGTGNVGGKNVYTLTNSDGSVGYGYVSGDTLFMIDSSVTQSEATKILAALP